MSANHNTLGDHESCSSPKDDRLQKLDAISAPTKSVPVTPPEVASSKLVDTRNISPYLTTVRMLDVPPSEGEGRSGRSNSETSMEGKSAEMSPSNIAFPALTVQALGNTNLHQPLSNPKAIDARGVIKTIEQADENRSEKVKRGDPQKRVVSIGANDHIVHTCQKDTSMAGCTVDLTGDLLFEDEEARSRPDTGTSETLGRGCFHHSTPSLALLDGLVSFQESTSDDTSVSRQISSEVTRPRLPNTPDESDPWEYLGCLDDAGIDPLATNEFVARGSNDNDGTHPRPLTPQRSQYDSMGLDLFERSISTNGIVTEPIDSPKTRHGQAELLRYEQRQSRVNIRDRTPPRVPQNHESSIEQISSPMKQPFSTFRFPSRQREDEGPDCHFKLHPKGIDANKPSQDDSAASCERRHYSALDAFNLPLGGPAEHRTNYSCSSNLLPELLPGVTAPVTTIESPPATRDNLRENRDVTLTEDPLMQEFDLSDDSSATLEARSNEEEITLDEGISGRAAWAKLTEMARADD